MKPLVFFCALTLCVSASASFADEGHRALPPAVDAFHAIIAKDWHAPGGPERLQSTCANAQAYTEASGNVAISNAPANVDRIQWKAAGKALNDASLALGTACSSGKDSDVTTRLSALHDRFHDIVKLVEGKAEMKP